VSPAGRPLIALTSYFETISWGVWRDVPAALLPFSYLRRIDEAGGAPVLLPALPDVVEDVLARADALLVSGGPDVDPARYGAPRDPRTQPPNHARDTAELAALQAAQRRGMPVLAICRGAQLLAVSRGGTLHQHLPAHTPRTPGQFEQHPIRIAPESTLGGVLGSSALLSCHHHQGIDTLGEGLVATAWNDAGGIEGVEDPSAPFTVAVQAHPEEPGDTAALFTAFISAARQHRESPP
jgi:putative glutamine amidotransferase